MTQASYNLIIFLVEKSIDFENPPSIISLSTEECEDLVEKIRNKIYDLLSPEQDPNNPLGWKKGYNIYLEDGKKLNMEDVFSIYYDKNNKKFPPLYFSSSLSSFEFIENKLKQEEKKLKQEEKKKKQEEKIEEIRVEKERDVILNSLKKNIKDLKTFDQVVSPEFLSLINSKPELDIFVYHLNSLQLTKLNEEVKSFKEYLSCQEFYTETDRDDAIAQCIKISLLILRLDETNQYQKLKFHHQFSISPHFPYFGSGFERTADLAVYEESFNKIININGIKNKDDDIEECIRPNADLLRAYCLCYDKKIGRGIATTGEEWIFTQYNKSSETFKISELYEIFEKQFGMARSFIITDNYKKIFETLIGFIVESFKIMNNC